jgi:hypothetical protein
LPEFAGGEEKLPFADSRFDVICRKVCQQGKDLQRKKLPL